MKKSTFALLMLAMLFVQVGCSETETATTTPSTPDPSASTPATTDDAPPKTE